MPSSFPQNEGEAERVAKAAWHENRAQRLLPLVGTAIVVSILTVPFLLMVIAAFFYPAHLPVIPLWGVAIAAAWTIRRRRESHLRSAAGLRQVPGERIVEQAIKANAPLILYLREFDLERQDLEAPSSLVSFGSDRIRRSVEAALLESVESATAIVALTDPTDPNPIQGVHRFSEIPASWQELVEQLIRASTVIVVYFSTLSGGISTELNLIRRCGRSDATLLIAKTRRLKRSLAKSGGTERILLAQSSNLGQRLRAELQAKGLRVTPWIKKPFWLKHLRRLGGPLLGACITTSIALAIEPGLRTLQAVLFGVLGLTLALMFLPWYLSAVTLAVLRGWQGSPKTRWRKRPTHEAHETPKLDRLLEFLRANQPRSE